MNLQRIKVELFSVGPAERESALPLEGEGQQRNVFWVSALTGVTLQLPHELNASVLLSASPSDLLQRPSDPTDWNEERLLIGWDR